MDQVRQAFGRLDIEIRKDVENAREPAGLPDAKRHVHDPTPVFGVAAASGRAFEGEASARREFLIRDRVPKFAGKLMALARGTRF
jgi:hypothetical protein